MSRHLCVRIQSGRTASTTLAVAGLLLLLAGGPRFALAGWGSGGNGIPVVSSFPSGLDIRDVRAIPDGGGGVFVLWSDNRYGTYYRTPFLQHLTSAGTPFAGWSPDTAFQVCDPALPNVDLIDATMAPDLTGGAYVCWSSGFVGQHKVYIQRVTSSGTVASGWPRGGVLVCPNTPGDQRAPQVASDGTGGAVVAWLDSRCYSMLEPTLYVQRINGTNGQGVWTPTPPPCQEAWGGQGVVLPAGFPVTSIDDYSLTSDGQGGAVIAWTRNSPFAGEMHTQRVTAAGAWDWDWNYFETSSYRPFIRRFGPNGYHLTYTRANASSYSLKYGRIATNGMPYDVLSMAVQSYAQTFSKAVSDGSTGAILGWTAAGQKFAHHATALPTVAACWPSNGRLVDSHSLDARPEMVSDTRGGAVFVDGGSPAGSLYAYRVLADGTFDPAYGTNGIPVFTGPGASSPWSVAGVSSNRLVAAWLDTRTVASVYANEHTWSLGPFAPGVTDLAVGPQRGPHSLLLTWTGVQDDPTLGAVAYYDIRSSASTIGVETFDDCNQVAFVASLGADEPHCLSVENLSQCTVYYFAIRAVYACGQLSTIQCTPQTSTLCSGKREVFCMDGYTARPYIGDDDPIGVPLRLSLSTVRPNPVSRHATVTYGVPTRLDGAPLEAALFDVAGRRVQEIASGVATAGRHLLDLDVRSGGRAIRAGMYFLRVRVGGESLARSVLITD